MALPTLTLEYPFTSLDRLSVRKTPRLAFRFHLIDNSQFVWQLSRQRAGPPKGRISFGRSRLLVVRRPSHSTIMEKEFKRTMPESEFICVTREGFRVNRDRLTLPKDASALDPKSKRAVTICNLFVNHKLGVQDITRVLDEDQERVIRTLLDQGIILDRRIGNLKNTRSQERRKIKTVLSVLRR